MKLTKKLILLFIIAITCIEFSYAQDKIIDKQELAWNNFSINKKFTKFSVRGELSIRRSDFYKNWQQFLTRGMFYYHLNSDLKVGIGSSYIETFPYGNQPIPTRRTDVNFFEQIIYKTKLQRFSFTQNARFEHFFREQFITEEDGIIYKDGIKTFSKLRYQITVNYNLKKFKNKDKLYLKAFDEIHFSTTNNWEGIYFQQNRYYLGIGYKMQHLNLTIGYKNQRIYKSDKVHIENNRMLDLGVGFII